MKNFAAREHQGRATLPDRLVADPELLLHHLAQASLDVADQKSVHYANYGMAALGVVLSADGTFKRISGANYTPSASAWPRTCAEKGMLRASAPGDVFGGAIALRSPFKKQIEGVERDMVTVPPCPLPCSELLLRISPDLVIVTFEHGSLEPKEAYTVGDLVAFQKGKSDEYPAPPDGMEVEDYALQSLATFMKQPTNICEHPLLYKPSLPRPLSLAS